MGKIKGFFKKTAMILTAVAAAVCLLMPAAPALAASEGSQNASKQITFVLEDADGSTVKSVKFKIKSGQTYGAGADDEVSVRNTYYDKEDGIDYDLTGSNPSTSGKVTSESSDASLTFHYQTHDEAVYTIHCVSGGKTLKTIQTMVLTNKQSKTVELPETIEYEGQTYERPSDQSSVTVQYGSGEAEQNVEYTASDTDASAAAYKVKVTYVDTTSGTTLGTRSFAVSENAVKAKKTVTFYAPVTLAVTVDGQTVYYTAKDKDAVVLKHQAGVDAKSYTINYVNSSTSGDAYDWTILQYDSSTGECIGYVTKTVKPGGEATFDPTSENTIDQYTVNKFYKKKITHKYTDTPRVTYVYYDPDGYNNDTSSLKEKQITVQYVNIANGSVLKKKTVSASPEQDTRIEFPDSFEQNGRTYLRVDGQDPYVDHNYYSARQVYTIYYRDKDDKTYENYTIHTTTIVDLPVQVEKTIYRVVPGDTIIEAVDNTTGQRRVLNRTDARGNTVNTTDGNDQDADVSVDGNNTDEIQTPQGNIHLKGQKDKTIREKAVAGTLIGAAAAAVILFWLLMRRNRNKKKA